MEQQAPGNSRGQQQAICSSRDDGGSCEFRLALQTQWLMRAQLADLCCALLAKLADDDVKIVIQTKPPFLLPSPAR
jgi:hypothetical protein